MELVYETDTETMQKAQTVGFRPPKEMRSRLEIARDVNGLHWTSSHIQPRASILAAPAVETGLGAACCGVSRKAS